MDDGVIHRNRKHWGTRSKCREKMQDISLGNIELEKPLKYPSGKAEGGKIGYTGLEFRREI